MLKLLNIKYRILAIVSIALMAYYGTSSAAPAACDPSVSSCAPSTALPACTGGECFPTVEAKVAYEASHNCKFAECSNEVKDIPLSVLQQIFPASTSMSGVIAEELNNALQLTATQGLINTKRKLAHLLAQVKQEVGASSTLTENLNYQPSVLILKSSYFQNHPDEAYLYGRTANHPANQQAIANRMYANGVGPGNGSVASGDGWKYRGRGIIQLTGKYNYQVFTTKQKLIWGDDVDFVQNPEMVLQGKYAVRSALVFWKVHNLSSLAEQGISQQNSYNITEIVNKHTDTYTARFNNLTAIMSLDFFKECPP